MNPIKAVDYSSPLPLSFGAKSERIEKITEIAKTALTVLTGAVFAGVVVASFVTVLPASVIGGAALIALLTLGAYELREKQLHYHIAELKQPKREEETLRRTLPSNIPQKEEALQQALPSNIPPPAAPPPPPTNLFKSYTISIPKRGSNTTGAVAPKPKGFNPKDILSAKLKKTDGPQKLQPKSDEHQNFLLAALKKIREVQATL